MTADIFAEWVSALEARHLANFRIQEVTRALRALSSAYVQRRGAIARGGTLDTAGKRAAFSLFYAPLHFLVTREIVRGLSAHDPPPRSLVDLGCGSGAAGAAWALESGGRPKVVGLDRHPWAVEEARWTYRQLRLDATARQADAARFRPPRDADVVAAYVLNELQAPARERLTDSLLAAAAGGSRVLVIEPIARAVAPWWDGLAAQARARGGRADEWRFRLDLPPLLRTLDKAAGLNHSEIKARSIVIGGSADR